MTNTAGPHFVLSGRRDGTSTDYQGTYGRYWSSSAYASATYAYSLHLNGTNSAVGLVDYNNERLGFSLRCLALIHQKKEEVVILNPSASQPVTLLENTKLSTITIIAGLLCKILLDHTLSSMASATVPVPAIRV